jgi:acyl-CoA thioester hydrolase
MDGTEQTGLGAISYETAFAYPLTPVAADIDEMGHVNNTVYLRWVQEAATRHWFHVAPPAITDAFVFIVLRHEIDYRDPVLLGDDVEVRTWLGKASGPRFDRHVDIRKKGAPRFSARAVTTWVMIDKASGRPKRVGEEVFNAFAVSSQMLL